MEELLSLHEEKAGVLSRGQKVKGKVTGKTKRSVIIDIGGKSEGVVAEKAFQEAKKYISGLKVGDEVRATVLIPETPDGFSILSLREASSDAAWGRIEEAREKANPLSVFGKSVNPSGVAVEVFGLSGFVPTSQLGKKVSRNAPSLVGKSFEVVPIEVNRTARKIVLSEKEVSEADDIKLQEAALKKIKEGEVYAGVVTTVVDFGCFVQIKIPLGKKSRSAGENVPVEGLVHISELSWEKVDDPKQVVSQGDEVKVKVLGKDLARTGRGVGRLALSIKQAEPDPWEDADKKYKKDSKVSGKVARVSEYGIFVQLEPGIEGLIHMTKIPPGEKLEEGQKIEVYVEEIDTKVRRLSLGLVLTKKPVGYK
jgi:ribosomal protein S1